MHFGRSGNFFVLRYYFAYWPYRLTVRTEPSQGLNRGSIPRRGIAPKRLSLCRVFWCYYDCPVSGIEPRAAGLEESPKVSSVATRGAIPRRVKKSHALPSHNGSRRES